MVWFFLFVLFVTQLLILAAIGRQKIALRKIVVAHIALYQSLNTLQNSQLAASSLLKSTGEEVLCLLQRLDAIEQRGTGAMFGGMQ